MGGHADQCREDSQNGLPAVPGGRDTVDRIIQEEDDGGGVYITGAADRSGTVRGMWDGDGGGIVCRPQDDTTWAGGRGEMEMGSLGHGRRPADIQAGLTDQGRDADLTCRELPRTGRDKDGDADALLQLACPGCSDHL